MSKLIINPILSQPRILNLTSIELHSDRVLEADGNSASEIFSKIREQNDLPYVYLVDNTNKEIVVELVFIISLFQWFWSNFNY